MSRRILIVDDEDDIREVAQVSLEMMRGWEVSTASSGAEALEVVARDAPDAVLLDVMMPEMDGPTLVRHLRSNPRTAALPVVMLTAKVQGSDQRMLSELEVAGVLAKPFDPTLLADEVARLLGWDD
jgi:CheY-like chemotaxis protein